MNIKIIKNEIEKNVGKKVIGKINMGRNKFENFEGIINASYPFLFTIESENEIKSFSYSDVLTKTIELKVK